MLTEFLENPDDWIKLLDVLLGNSKGCSVANLEKLLQDNTGFFQNLADILPIGNC